MDGFPCIDPVQFRNALGHYASGITIITGTCSDRPVGFTCQSFYSVSIDPPLVSFSVQKASRSWPRIRPRGTFAVNLLSSEQSEISTSFAGPEDQRWTGIDWKASEEGNPLLDGTVLNLNCALHAEHEAGDHIIILGRVLSIFSSPQSMSPLLYFKGSYRQLAEISETA